MIKTVSEHNILIQEVKEKVFGAQYAIENLTTYPTVSIRNKADILFANLNKYHLFEEEHFNREHVFYKELLYHQVLNAIDLNFHYQYLVENILSVKGNPPKGDSPCLYCSFHYGSYVHVSTALRILEKSFTVVSNLTEGFQAVQWEQAKAVNNSDPANFHSSQTIHPQDLDSTFQIFNTLRKGKSVLVYIDSFFNKTEAHSKRNKEFHLFNATLSIASAIPEISQKANVPIIPVIAERRSDHTLEVTFYDAVCEGDVTVEKYSTKAFQQCFQLFSKHLRTHPEQWDQWQLIHNHFIQTPKDKHERKSVIKLFKSLFVSGATITKGEIIGFNEDDFQIFQREGTNYLLNINNYKCFKITSHLVKILKTVNKKNFTVKEFKKMINPTLYNDLVSKRVLKAKKKSD